MNREEKSSGSSGSKPSIETVLRKTFKKPLDSIARVLIGWGLTPNHITLFGMFGNLAAAVLIARGDLLWGGVAALLVAPLDAVDGAMARQLQRPGKFGAFLDSFIDRYDELILFGGILYYYFSTSNELGLVLTYLAACGAVLVSYARARAEGLGFSGKVGILTRVERSIVLIAGLLFGFPLVSVGIIAVLANFTAIQRLVSVWKQSEQASR